MRTTQRALLVAVCAVCAAGGCVRMTTCTTAYLSDRVAVPATGSRIALVAESDPREPLLEREVQRKLAYLVRERGYEVVEEDAADAVLAAFFAIDSGRQVIEAYDIYHPGRTETFSAYTRYGRRAYVRYWYPDYHEQRLTTRIEYTATLDLTLFDRQQFKSEDEPNQERAIAWRAKVDGVSGSPDLRSDIDYLLVAAFEQFGVDTGRCLERSYTAGNDEVRSVREAGRVESPAASATEPDSARGTRGG